MSIVTVTSNDTLTLNNRVIVDQSVDDVTSITFPNELVSRKTGKNGNTLYALNQQGTNADMTIRVARGSADDQWLNSQIPSANGDFPSTTFLSGTFVKRLGDGQGNVISDTYTLTGGVITRNIEGKENVSGDTTQAEAVYTIKFASASRQEG